MTQPDRNSTAYHDTTFVDGQTRYVADLLKYIEYLESQIKAKDVIINDLGLYCSILEIEVKELSETLEI